MTCQECEGCRAKGFAFCRYCGDKLEPPRQQPEINYAGTFDKVVLTSSILVTILILVEIASVIIGLGKTFDSISDGMKLSISIIFPVLIRLCYLSGTVLDIYWILVLMAFLASAAAVFWQSRRMFSIRDDQDSGEYRNTPLFWIGMLFGSSIVIQLFMLLIMNSNGIVIETPNLPTDASGDAIIMYTNAGVWEEIACRMLLIGVPMLAIALYKGYSHPFRYLLGGFGTSKVSVILIVISSVMFSYGHVSGWGAFKFPLVMVGGLIMGWLYVRFGIHASILFHCTADLMTVAMNTVGLASLLDFAIIMLGFVCTVILAYTLFKSLGTLKDLPMIKEDQDSIFRRRD